MNNKPHEVAIIGCGHIGKRHASIVHEKARLAAVCDILPERADALAALYHCPAFYNLDNLLQNGPNVEAVAICTPNYLHASQSIAALQSGLHVLCEKPMAINAADAETMMAAAKEAGKHLSVVKQNRYNPPVAWVKEQMNKGCLGEIYSVYFNGFWNRPDEYYRDNWKGKLKEDGGTLFTQFSHFVDLLIWFLGELHPVSCKFMNIRHKNSIEFEDTGMVLATSAENIPVSLQYSVNSYAQNLEGSITILGEKGSLKIGGQYLNVLEYARIEGIEKPQLHPGNPANDYGYYTGSMSNHPMVYDSFLELIRTPFAIHPPLLEAVETVRFIEHCYQHR